VLSVELVLELNVTPSEGGGIGGDVGLVVVSVVGIVGGGGM